MHNLKEAVLNAKSSTARFATDALLQHRARHAVRMVDMGRVHAAINVPLRSELSRVLSFSTDFESELYVRRFENDFATLCKRNYAAGTHSGTAALQLGLLALGIGPGDEVITVPNTYIATALAISNVGAKPVFVDIQEHSFNIDVCRIEAAITSRTRAIIPVHLFGQMADMASINAIAAAKGLNVIEDACQAFGAEREGCMAGAASDLGCFSFSTSKNLSGFGNGGIVVSNDKELVQRIRVLRNPEADSPFVSISRRTPCYLDAIQVALLRSKLPYIKLWAEARQRHATIYHNAFRELPIRLPQVEKRERHSYYRFAIRTSRSAELHRWLLRRGVHAVKPYSPSLHLTPAFANLGYPIGAFPNAEKMERDTLLLPISALLTDDEVMRVTDAVVNFFA